MAFHIDIPPPHVDIPPPHVDIPPPHVDIPPPHVDIPPPHVDIPPPHVDIPPPHVDIPPPHVDIPVHIDVPPPHIDIAPPHIDIPVHIDIPPPHIDIPPPHIDIAPPHIDLGHFDLGHIDLGHGDLGHVDVPHVDIPVPHVDAAPPHIDIGYNHWWQNWPKTHAYVAKRMFFPTSVDDIARGVKSAESDGVPLRAIGGGWSFSDAVLPGTVTTGRPDVMTSDGIDRFLPLAEGFPLDDQSSIASIDADNGWLIGYDASNVRLLGGARPNVGKLEQLLQPPQPQPGYLMNTRSLKATLQPQLADILSAAALAATAPGPNQKRYFHVEAGITMDEIGALLDAQSPRLQLRASGGNPGATLAGSLSTATHGAEFSSPLLIDRVKAVHLVGPGGQQWWIEGQTSIADVAKLQTRYAGLDAAHILTGTAPVSGLQPQDWLNAAVVSMGCMGVLYSVVLEVDILDGSQQVTRQTTWSSFLTQVKSRDPRLAKQSVAQIQAVLRNPADPLASLLNEVIAGAIEDGMFSQGIIPAGKNTYADLAFNPNPAPAGLFTLDAGDFDCWIVNRQSVPMAFDSQPPSTGGLADAANSIFTQLGKAFAINGNAANLDRLAIRLAEVYGLTKPFHVDIPLHVDIPPPHIDVPAPHIDIPPPHIDIPPPHIDLGHIDVGHVDVGHVDLGHIDIPVHVDLGGAHIDIPPPHIDIPPPHIDIPPPHIDIAPPHIDVGHVDINGALAGLVQGALSPFFNLLTSILGISSAAAPILEQLVLGGADFGHLVDIIKRVTGAADTLDVALDALTTPLVDAQAMDIAQPFLTGLLASTLGTANDAGIGVSIGSSVGSIGFPNSGLLGAAIEIAMPVDTAFGFLQRAVLDAMNPAKPFFGYVSVRITPQTQALLGMQQWPTSVMIEVVAFGDAWGIEFIRELQARALAFIGTSDSAATAGKGQDAMLHWGLENDQMTWMHLNNIPALQSLSVPVQNQPPLSKLAAFSKVRSLLFSNGGLNPANLFPAFDNTFTARLRL